MRSKVVVPTISDANLPLFLAISAFRDVVTLERRVRLPFLGRLAELIPLADLEAHFDWQDIVLVKSRDADAWAGVRDRLMAEGPWVVNARGLDVDVSAKARQDLQHRFERRFIAGELAAGLPGARVVDTACDALVARKVGRGPFPGRRARILSAMNRPLDAVHQWLEAMGLAVRTLRRLRAWGRAATQAGDQRLARANHIWDGVSPRELDTSHERNTFAWIVDDSVVTRDSVVFVLPDPDFQMSSFSMGDAEREGFLCAGVAGLGARVARPILASCAAEARRCALASFFALFRGLKGSMCAAYRARMLEWAPLAEAVRPDNYVTSLSVIGHEDPVVPFMHAMGVKTVMWFYGTNSFYFTRDAAPDAFRDVTFFDVCSAELVVWNANYRDFLLSHGQSGARCVVLGPLMPGDAAVMGRPRAELQKAFGLPTDSRCLAVFDSPPVAAGHRSPASPIPDPNTAAHNAAFLADCLRLLDDFEELHLIYKPKRSLTSGKFEYADETRRLMDRMKDHPRVLVLDYNVNPWLPIALADACVSIPFESPSIAALHHGRAGFFHDALKVVRHHRYQSAGSLVTHGYDELAESALRVMRGAVETSSRDLLDLVGIPGQDCTAAFRTRLAEGDWPFPTDRPSHEGQGERA